MVSTSDTRDQILDATASVIVREGATCLTLEKVAREAGISKGGLLYHFSGKQRLIEALIERMIGRFEDDRSGFEHEEEANGPGVKTRAFVRATLEGNWDRKSGLRPHGVEIFAALVGALATDPKLLAPVRKRYADWQEDLEHDQICPAHATVARLAADGLWFAELLGIANFRRKQRDELVRVILSLACGAERPRVKKVTA